MIQDPNYVLLGMNTNGVDIGSIPDWQYIHEHGQSSISFYNTMVQALSKPIAKYRFGVRRFSTSILLEKEGSEFPLKGLHAFFSHSGEDYGRIMILEYSRALNTGDVSLVEFLSEMISIHLAALSSRNEPRNNRRILVQLIRGTPMSPHDIEYFYSIVCGQKQARLQRENWQLSLLCIRFCGQPDTNAMEMLGKHMVARFPLVFYDIFDEILVAVLYAPQPDHLARQIVGVLDEYGGCGQLQYGLSLPVTDNGELSHCFSQAMYAITQSSEPGLRDFYDCAARYLILEKDDSCRLSACEPKCRMLWNDGAKKRESLKTLSVYLREGRAAGNAATQLYIHKNTLNYRIKYLKDLTGWNLDSPEIRDYLRLSLFFLEEIERRQLR